MAQRFLIYGANGFTGRLIAERAHERGMRPIVAGRSRQPIEAIGARLGLEARVFDLSAPRAIDDAVRDATLVLHCAGPFSQTSNPMVDACLRAGCSYLDISGELGVLEAVLSRDAEARAARTLLLPAVGFDVVPTDCMAATLHRELPDATRLELAFSGGLKPSPGTAKTAVENLHVGALVREEGRLIALRAPRTREVPFAHGSSFVMSIPWGDLVTAFHSTGIPSIAMYTMVPRGVARAAPLLRVAAPLLRRPGTVRFLQRWIEKRAQGPTEEQRKSARMSIWGRVENAAGVSVEGHLETPEGYELTVLAALACVERVLGGDVPPGATTPSKAFGADFVTTLPGVGTFRIVRGDNS
jgi:saccharopine dehydrogenase (NAD+, L-lysine-forming)